MDLKKILVWVIVLMSGCTITPDAESKIMNSFGKTLKIDTLVAKKEKINKSFKKNGNLPKPNAPFEEYEYQWGKGTDLPKRFPGDKMPSYDEARQTAEYLSMVFFDRIFLGWLGEGLVVGVDWLGKNIVKPIEYFTTWRFQRPNGQGATVLDIVPRIGTSFDDHTPEDYGLFFRWTF